MEPNKSHCVLCFQVVEAHWKAVLLPPLVPAADQVVAVFVTWKKHGKLRGCIGSLTALPHPQCVVEFALKSALQDSRFPQITLAELEHCTVGVSFLLGFESGLNWDEWEVGMHGIILRFQHYRAVFLPEVAVERRWSKLDTIKNLVKKTGFQGEVDLELLSSISIERFTSCKHEASYAECKDLFV
ncbi:hypothetical protein BASA81_000419 [Batrachochytrium salamandrivorans]|nr:hypothetical protein BASA81_000419 [Batrachochytrium salamandrivorans]